MTKSKHPISPGNEPFQVQPQSAVIRPTQPIILDNVSDQVFDGQKMTIMAADNQQTDTADHGDTLRLVKCSNVTIRNFTFNGNRDNRGGFAGSPVTIRLNGCTDIVIENCIFLNGVCADIFLWCYASPQDPNDHCLSLIHI